MKRTFADERQGLLDLAEDMGMRQATSHPILPEWLLSLGLKLLCNDITHIKYLHLDQRVDSPESAEKVIEYNFEFASRNWKMFKFPTITVEYKGEDHLLERRFFETDIFAMSRIVVFKRGWLKPRTVFDEVFIKKGLDRNELDEIAIKLKMWFGSSCSF